MSNQSRLHDIIHCDNCPLQGQAGLDEHDASEIGSLQKFKSGEVIFDANTDIQSAGMETSHLYTLLEGYAYRYVLLPDGRRQILNFLFPGDFIGLQASLFLRAEHSVATLSAARLCVFEKKRLVELFEEKPQLAYGITWLTANEQSFMDLNAVALGRYSARERVAYLLYHLYVRAEAIGLADRNSCSLPITQQHIADALALTLPYTNKALNDLKRGRLLSLERGRLHILDMAKLQEHAVICLDPRENKPYL